LTFCTLPTDYSDITKSQMVKIAVAGGSGRK
jgi:hypothetical protein